VVKWHFGKRAADRIRAADHIRAAFLVTLALLVLSMALPANAASPSTVYRLPATHGPTDPAELEAFLDEVVSAQLETHQIPGAAVAVVKDGELFFTKGYGFVHSRSQTPVQADRTLFHAGSITKLFTWTAVMQLVEQGRLDLHTDINTYLTDFQIPATYPEPITLFHLLTHTPGFEDQLSNLFRFGANDALSLNEYIVRKLPTRVYPPGEIIGYSNYGAALAGYIIQEVTGMPYEQYIEENLLAPLEMHRSTIRQPVPAEWMSDLALGHYPWLTGPAPLHEYFPSAPVVGLSATVTDIAKFMIAHLQDGQYDETRILQAETAQEMHQQQFTHDPRLPGVTYGFTEWERHGERLLWHGGSTGFFESMIMLFPERNIGVFIAYNRKAPPQPGREFRQAFMDHYYPLDNTSHPQPHAAAAALARTFAGDYRESRWSHTLADKVVYMFTRYYKMDLTADGNLQLDGVTYVATEPQVFQAVEGEGTLVFQTNGSGKPVYAFYDYDPHKVFIKLAWYETRAFHLSILIVCTTLFISALVAGSPGRAPEHAPWIISETHSIFQWLGALNLFYPVGMLAVGVTVLIDAWPDLAFLAPMFILALLVTLFIAVILVTMLWAGRYWNLTRRVYYTLVVLASCMFTAWLNYWNLLRLWRF